MQYNTIGAVMIFIFNHFNSLTYFRMNGPIYCAAFECRTNSFNSPNTSFFKFPKNLAKAKIWMARVGREDLERKSFMEHRLCSLHFNNDDIIKSNYRRRLKTNALPLSFSLPDETPSVLTSLEVQHKGPKILTVFYAGEKKWMLQDDDIMEIEILDLHKHLYNFKSLTDMSIAPSTSVSSIQTPKKISNNTPRKVKLRRRINILRRKLKVVRQQVASGCPPNVNVL